MNHLNPSKSMNQDNSRTGSVYAWTPHGKPIVPTGRQSGDSEMEMLLTEAQPSQINPTLGLKPAKILVVDDEKEIERLIRQRFRRQIQLREYEFLFVSNGHEAQHQLQSGIQVDLVVTDINMPVMDGLTFIELLPDIDPTLRAIVISAYSDMDNLRKAMNLGAYDFVVKPIDFVDLEKTISNSLERVRQARIKQRQYQIFYAELIHKTLSDSLTSLPNRTYLIERLSQIIERQNHGSGQLYAVLFIDLDNFKAINDTQGHLIGDEFLKCVAKRLLTCVRQSDIVARLAGDEFVVLLDEVENINSAIAIANRIDQSLKKPFSFNNEKVISCGSIGIVMGSELYESPDMLLRDADMAMYKVKRTGKGGYQVFSTDGETSQLNTVDSDSSLTNH